MEGSGKIRWKYQIPLQRMRRMRTVNGLAVKVVAKVAPEEELEGRLVTILLCFLPMAVLVAARFLLKVTAWPGRIGG